VSIAPLAACARSCSRVIVVSDVADIARVVPNALRRDGHQTLKV